MKETEKMTELRSPITERNEQRDRLGGDRREDCRASNALCWFRGLLSGCVVSEIYGADFLRYTAGQ